MLEATRRLATARDAAAYLTLAADPDLLAHHANELGRQYGYVVHPDHVLELVEQVTRPDPYRDATDQVDDPDLTIEVSGTLLVIHTDTPRTHAASPSNRSARSHQLTPPRRSPPPCEGDASRYTTTTSSCSSSRNTTAHHCGDYTTSPARAPPPDTCSQAGPPTLPLGTPPPGTANRPTRCRRRTPANRRTLQTCAAPHSRRPDRLPPAPCGYARRCSDRTARSEQRRLVRRAEQRKVCMRWHLPGDEQRPPRP